MGAYFAFGEHAASNNPDADAVTYTFNLRYPGQLYDSESGLHYNINRDYEAGTGRYVQSDPIGLNGGLSTYGYAMQNPYQYIDSLGLKVEVRCRPIGGPYRVGAKAQIARDFGGEHCYVVASCSFAGIPETTISYLVPIFVVPRGGSHNSDTIFSSLGRYRTIAVTDSSGGTGNCPSFDACKLESCVVNTASLLMHDGYRMGNYSAILGPNSNSFARRLVEGCGGRFSGFKAPLTGWYDAGEVGF